MSKEKVNSLKDKDTEVSPNAEASLESKESDKELNSEDLDNVAGGYIDVMDIFGPLSGYSKLERDGSKFPKIPTD